MKPRHLLMGVGLAGAALLAVFGDKSPETAVAEAVVREPGAHPAPSTAPSAAASPAPLSAPAPRASAPAPSPAGAGAGEGPRILALVPRESLIGDSEGQFGQGDNGVFGRRDWTPPPPPPAPAPPPPPPQAPPLPFTFIGKSVADGAWEIYLARGDRTYVVQEHAVIDGLYRVERIAPPVLTLTYLPLNQVQQLNIGVFD